MKITLLMLVCHLLCLPAVVVAQGKKYAFIVGAGKYPGRWPATLADRDAGNLAKTLELNGWKVFLCSSNLEDRQPTYSNLLKFLGLSSSNGNIVFQPTAQHFSGDSLKLRSEDKILFHFGGHGIVMADNANSFIVPSDIGETINPEKLISVNLILYALRQTGAGEVFVSIDACRNAVSRNEIIALKKLIVVPIPVPQVEETSTLSKPLIFVIQSADLNQFSHDNIELDGGVYSYFLRCLISNPTAQAEADFDKNSEVSYWEAAQYLQKNTEQYVSSMDSRQSEQKPVYYFENPDHNLLEKPFLTGDNEASENIDTWIKSLIQSSKLRFLDMKDAVVEPDNIYEVKKSVIFLASTKLVGRYERDFAARDCIVYRSGLVDNDTLGTLVENLKSNLEANFRKGLKAHAQITVFLSSDDCQVRLIEEKIDKKHGRITIEFTNTAN